MWTIINSYIERNHLRYLYIHRTTACTIHMCVIPCELIHFRWCDEVEENLTSARHAMKVSEEVICECVVCFFQHLSYSYLLIL